MRLVDNAKNCWRWFSMRAMAGATALLGAWEVLPTEMHSVFPAKVVMGLAGAMLIIGMIGRLVKQDQPQEPPKDKT